MKSKWFIMVLAIGLGASVNVPESRAGDEGWAAFGGFVGGTLLSNLSHNSHHRSNRSSYDRCSSPPRVVSRPSGHYEYRTEKVWNEGYWVYEKDRCGRTRKVKQPGYYSYQKTKVWVSDGYRSGSHRRSHYR